MSRFRTLGLAALSFAASAAVAQGIDGAPPGERACQGDCGAAADLDVPAWVIGMPHAARGHDPLPGFGLFSTAPSGSAPLLHATSFSALAAHHPQYLPFDGMAGPHDRPVPAFAGMPGSDFAPPLGGAGDGSPLAGPSAPPRAIPEPNIYALMLAGLAAGAWASRRRKR